MYDAYTTGVILNPPDQSYHPPWETTLLKVLDAASDAFRISQATGSTQTNPEVATDEIKNPLSAGGWIPWAFGAALVGLVIVMAR